MRRTGTGTVALATMVLLTGCGSGLPAGTTAITVGRTVVRTDSLLDAAGVLFSIADSATVPPLGPVRTWFESRALAGLPAIEAARAVGAAPISVILEAWSSRTVADTVCGRVAPGGRICLAGNAAVNGRIASFLEAASAAYRQVADASLPRVSAAERLEDLSDVRAALTRGKALDSAVMAYSGYGDLSFEVTLARTFSTGGTTPGVDPARPRDNRAIFLTPDPVFTARRSYRSAAYVWLMLAHQMSHAVVSRLFEEQPELLSHGFHLSTAVEPEMARFGYSGVFWDETLGEQLARALTARILRATSPTVSWAARADALVLGMALAPWLEDALARYEAHRDSFPTLSHFAPRLAAALDAVPLDTCRGAPSPGVLLAAVERHRAVVRWMAPDSPFRARGLRLGDTVVTVDGDSVAGTEVLLPTRQLNAKWSQRLPAELGILGIRRRGTVYGVSVPIAWVPRAAVRVASQARPEGDGSAAPHPICRWITRAVR
jgi:hypothetical protein